MTFNFVNLTLRISINLTFHISQLYYLCLVVLTFCLGKRNKSIWIVWLVTLTTYLFHEEIISYLILFHFEWYEVRRLPLLNLLNIRLLLRKQWTVSAFCDNWRRDPRVQLLRSGFDSRHRHVAGKWSFEVGWWSFSVRQTYWDCRRIWHTGANNVYF